MPFIAPLGRIVRAGMPMILLALAIAVLAPRPAAATDTLKALIKVGDTTAPNAQLNTVISVFMQNYIDTIAGFKIYLQLDNPDIMQFQGDSGTSIDTSYWDCTEYSGMACVESVLTIPGSADFFHVDTNTILIGNFDTVGTLASGWQFLTSRSLSTSGNDILLAGIADDAFVPGFKQGILPQTSNTPLVKLLADVNNLPDSLTGDDRKTNIVIQYLFVSNFGLSRPDGSAIGIAYNQYLDTNLYVCNQWAGSVCIGGWERTPTPPYDSIAVVLDSTPYIDTNEIIFDNGSLTVLPGPSYVCGDVNNNPTHSITVADLTYLISFLFNGGAAIPAPIQRANVNCSSNPNPTVADLTYLVNFLFNSGLAPCANCP